MTPVINQFAQERNLTTLKLHLGSGGSYLRGWVNIDNFEYENNDTSRTDSKYDVKMDIRDLDVEDESVDEIMLIHVMEHFVRWESINLIKQFHRKLKPGGLLIIEMPDLDKCIEWYLKGKAAPHINTPLGSINMGKTQFYGNQWDGLDYETHRYVWTLSEFINVLQAEGFDIVQADHNALFHAKGRDMLVAAMKQQPKVLAN